MKKFKNGQRVTVSACAANGSEDDIRHLEVKLDGSVVRLRRCDNGAFVCLDNRAPEDVHPFPVGDHRENHVLTYPEYCEAV